MKEDRKVLVCDAEAMQNLLDEILYSIPKGSHRAYDMRHAMLYLAFPDLYEGIISTRDKKKILDTYGQRVEGPLPSDIDQAILKVRQTLSKEYDTPDRPFDFYQQLNQGAKKRASTLEDQGQPYRSGHSSRRRH
jgi:hypothetical protein